MERSTLVRIGDLAAELLGEDSDRNRKVVRRLVDRGILMAVRTAPGGNGDRLVLRASVDAWIGAARDEFTTELAGVVEAMTVRERREQARRERAAAAI